MADAQTIEGAVAAKLLATDAITAIIAGRIHPSADPTIYARPKLYFQRLGTDRQYSNDGPLSLRQVRLEMFASADDALTAKTLAACVSNALDGFSGELSGICIGCIRITDESDETSTADDLGKTRPPQRVRLELTIDYQQ